MRNMFQEKDVGEILDKVVQEADKVDVDIRPVLGYLKESFSCGSISDQHG